MIEQNKCEVSQIDCEKFVKHFITSLKDDNNYPGIKTEVVYDTLISDSVLNEMIEYISSKYNANDNDKMLSGAKFVTKEFPLLNTLFYNCKDRHNIKADYLMYNLENKSVYIVELKTDNNSLYSNQFDKYISLLHKSTPDNEKKLRFEELLEMLYKKDNYFKQEKYKIQFEQLKKNQLIMEEDDEIVVPKISDVHLIYIVPDGKKCKKLIDDKKCENLRDRIHVISLDDLDNERNKIPDGMENLKMFMYVWHETK